MAQRLNLVGTRSATSGHRIVEAGIHFRSARSLSGRLFGFGLKEGLRSFRETRRLVEPKCFISTRAGRKHDLVAVRVPGALDRGIKHQSPDALSPAVRMSDDVFYERVGPTGPRQVRNDGDCAASDEQLVQFSNDDSRARRFK